MPRSRPAKPLTVLLPPLPSSSSSSSSSAPTASTSALTPAPSLDVLLLAQKIAREKGQVFDVESFMTMEQRHEYYTTVLHRSPPPSPKPVKRPIEEEASEAGSSSEGGSATTPKKPKIPNLSHLHWRQRQKKLAELSRLAELEEQGIQPPASPSANDTPKEVKDEKGKKAEATDAGSLQSSASYWNHLLIQARQERGPQWDYHSQSYHVDRNSTTYYTHGKEPRQDEPTKVKTEPTPPPPLLNGTLTNGHGPSDPSSSSRRQSSETSLAPHANPVPSPLSAPSPHLPTPQQAPSTPHNPMQQSPSHQSTPTHAQTATPSGQPTSLQPQRLPSHLQAQFAAAAQAGGTGFPRQPGQPPMSLTPQQLAQLSQLSQSGSNVNLQAAMAQLAARSQGQQPGQGLNPAALAATGNLGQFSQSPTQSGLSTQTPQALNFGQASAGFGGMGQGGNQGQGPMLGASSNWQGYTS